MNKLKELLKWVVFITLTLVSLSAFIVLAGESETIGAGCFMLCKLASAVGIYLCYIAGKHLYSTGWLPKYIIEELNRDK